MTNTTNYNLLLAEGTDLVNYLTQTNPNFTAIDTIIKGVSDDTVTPATEVTTGTAHAISRALPDATVIKFTATSNWQTGDTMTLDGTPVTPLKTDGTTLKTGDYIIGSAVLMIQDSTRLTVLVASSPDASDINYNNDGTHTWLTANKVEGAINEAATEIDNINGNLSVNNVTFTPASGVTINPTFTNCKKIGNVCYASIFITDTSIIPANSSIGSFDVTANGRVYALAYLSTGNVNTIGFRSVYINNNSNTLAMTEFDKPNGYAMIINFAFVCN